VAPFAILELREMLCCVGEGGRRDELHCGQSD
jgi:hypothetical protein